MDACLPRGLSRRWPRPLPLGTRRRIAMIQSVVGETASQGMKIIVTRLRAPAEKVSIGLECSTLAACGGCSTQGRNLGIADGESFVGTERRQNRVGKFRLRDRLMMAEVVGGIVGGAYDLDAEFLQYRLRGQALESGVGALPDRRRGFFIQQFGDAEVALQFKVRPVVERIAQRVGDGSRPGEKFFVGSGISGDVLFRECRWPASPAICSGRPPARFRTDSQTCRFSAMSRGERWQW